MSRSALLILMLVLAVALAVRIAVVERFSAELSNDRDGYLRLGHALAAGRGLVDPETGRPTAYRPPLYPMLIAAIESCGGGSRTLGQAQIALGMLTVAGTWFVGAQYLGERRAWLAAALVAVDPLLVQYTAFAMTETLFTFLVTALLAVSTRECGVLPSRQVLAGVFFGLAALCRPTIWPWAALVVLWQAVAALRAGGRASLWGLARRRAWLLVSAALVVLPWVVRNQIAVGSPILTTTHGGYTLLLANNPVVYREEVDKPWGTTWDDAPAGRRQGDWYAAVLDDLHRDLGAAPTEVEADRWMSALAWRHIRDEPATFLRACWLRVRRLWNIVPLGPAAANHPRPLIVGVGAFYALVFGAAAVGIVRLVRSAKCKKGNGVRPQPSPDAAGCATPVAACPAPLLLLLFSFTLTHAVYWSNARMRAPLMPAVAVLAAAGVCGMRKGDPSATPALVPLSRHVA